MAGVAAANRPIATTGSRRSFFRRAFGNVEFWRGIVSIAVFILLWELGSKWMKVWFGISLPYVGLLPPPSEVAVAWTKVLPKWGYWESWYQSFKRVLAGFLAAQAIGIPFGLMLAVNKYFRDIFFPPFEVLRPIPPLAWVPASLIFWPAAVESHEPLQNSPAILRWNPRAAIGDRNFDHSGPGILDLNRDTWLARRLPSAGGC